MLLYKVSQVKITPQWGSVFSGSGVDEERAINQSKRAVQSNTLSTPLALGLAAILRYITAPLDSQIRLVLGCPEVLIYFPSQQP